MKLSFILHRSNYLSYYAPLIRAAAERGWETELVIWPRGNRKKYLDLKAEDLPTIFSSLPTVRTVINQAEFQNLSENSQPSVWVSLHPRAEYFDNNEGGAYFVTLQHNVDSFLEATPEKLFSSDLFCFQSDFWLNFAAQYYEKAGLVSAKEFTQKMSTRAKIIGCPLYDVFAGINADEVRYQYQIPKEIPVVLYYPANVAYWPGHWPYFFRANTKSNQFKELFRGLFDEGIGFFGKHLPWALRGWNEVALTKSIRRFCNSNGYFLVAKARRKDPFRREVEQMADFAIYDQDLYPSTGHKLMAISDICIHFYSTAAMEAAVAGTYGICIDRPKSGELIHELWRVKNEGSAFNFPGVNDLRTVPQMIKDFPGENGKDSLINEEERKRFVEKYIGSGDGTASGRILDAIAVLQVEKVTT